MVIRFILLMMSVLIVGCSSTKTLKEIDGDGPQGGEHLFKMSKYVIEVKDYPTSRRLKFFFYTMDMKPLNLDLVEIKKGTLDPDMTKANYGIDFFRRADYIEGLVHTKYSEKYNYDVDLDVKIDGERKKITIPLRHD